MARWFAPEATVTAPDGRVWELYVGRFRGPRWTPREYDSPADAMEWNWNSSGVVLMLLELPLFVFNCILVPAVTYVLRLPAAVVRSRRSRTFTVEAVCWWPHEQRFRWSVKDGHVPRVMNQIAAGIAEGEWAQPTGAVFHGQETR